MLEINEKSYNIQDLFRVLGLARVPICFDSHCYAFNTTGLTVEGFDIKL